MIQTTRLLAFTFCLTFALPALSARSDSYSQNGQQGRTYNKKFRKNYRKYKTFSPKKKQRFRRLNKSVRGLSPEQKRKLRERVLNKRKNKPNY
jgi:hypothetical protein